MNYAILTAPCETKPGKPKVQGSGQGNHQKNFGLDFHATQITVCRQLGDRTPQPSLKMKWDQALKFIKDSGGPGIELHSCYEAGPFGYHLHRTLEEMGVTNIVVTPERLDPRCKRVKTDKRDARTLVGRLV